MNTSIDEALEFKNSVGFYNKSEIEKVFVENKEHIEATNLIDIETKNIILLRFYISFNILESFFFDKTKKIKDKETHKKRYMHNSDKFDDIQAFCNSKENFNKFSNENKKYFELYKHFKKIYFPNAVWNQRRGNTFNRYDIESIKEFLSSNIEYTEKCYISGALRLCYHFRNNLVHGAKSIYQLDQYLLDFIYIEEFLEELMNLIYKIDPKKKF